MPRFQPLVREPYPHPTLPAAYILPLHNGQTAVIDAADADRVSGTTWVLSQASSGKKPYVCASLRRGQEPLALARLVAGVTDPTLQVGYRDDDHTNCRRENLVVQTNSERIRRSRKRKLTTSRFKGVSLEKARQRWRASIRIDGRQMTLGRFKDEERAAREYDEAAAHYFGDHARLNFPALQRQAW
ncbi:MAG: Fis family transcriptional regulator [Phycisphaerales bacterium]|nr:Fis family transcriptional regulator [Phycisphaerales bacterium]